MKMALLWQIKGENILIEGDSKSHGCMESVTYRVDR